MHAARFAARFFVNQRLSFDFVHVIMAAAQNKAASGLRHAAKPLRSFAKMSGQFKSVGPVRIANREEEAFAAPLTGRTE